MLIIVIRITILDGDQLHIQKEWDKPAAENHQAQLFLRAVSDLEKARLLAADSPHSGDWLHVPPIVSVGLTLSDEAVRVAVAHRLECKACEPHTCPCGKAVDARDLHGLSCRRSGPRQQRHHQMNDILCMAIKRAQIAAVKEPICLLQQDGKHPDGTTLIPWACGKPITWDVTVPDTFAELHLGHTAREPGTAPIKHRPQSDLICCTVHHSHYKLLENQQPEAWIHGCMTLTVTKNGPVLLLKVLMFNVHEIWSFD